MTLTKKGLINAIQQENGYTLHQSAQIVETILEQMKASLGSGEDVLISGFGKFCVNEKDARKGRNPATGGSMILDARKVVTFKCSGGLREKLNR